MLFFHEIFFDIFDINLLFIELLFFDINEALIPNFFVDFEEFVVRFRLEFLEEIRNLAFRSFHKNLEFLWRINVLVLTHFFQETIDQLFFIFVDLILGDPNVTKFWNRGNKTSRPSSN